MRLLKMDKPQCLVYCAAMLLDCSPDELIKEIGHDGMSMNWTNLARPMCYRSHHIQEIIDCFASRGYGLMPVEYNPHQAPCVEVKPLQTFEHPEERFYNHIDGRLAIMIGNYKGQPHAWAWDGNTCYDPNGFITNLDDYEIQEAWVLIKGT